MNKNAYVMFRKHPAYPTQEVVQGIVHNGDKAVSYRDHNLNKSSVAVTWNSYGTARRIAERVKQVGGQHIMFENGYLKRSENFYAIGMDGINGNESNFINNVSEARWKKLNLEIKPWNKNGKYILVCAQRGGGYNTMAMPNQWPELVIDELITMTDIPIKYRPHPERQIQLDDFYKRKWGVETLDHREKIENQIKEACAIVVYTSNAANEALLQGVPVFYCGPAISCSHIALHGIDKINTPFYSQEREKYFHYLAHRQWHIEEIKNGEAWRKLIN